jgi:endonuclease-3
VIFFKVTLCKVLWNKFLRFLFNLGSKKTIEMNNRAEDLEPLFEKYGKRKHPLDYSNRYQLLAMVVLSAQDSDNKINKVSPDFFKAFPSVEELKKHTPEDLHPLLKSVRGFRKKSAWLVQIAQTIGEDSKIPLTIAELRESWSTFML